VETTYRKPPADTENPLCHLNPDCTPDQTFGDIIRLINEATLIKIDRRPSQYTMIDEATLREVSQ
jgi:hypothetical protein